MNTVTLSPKRQLEALFGHRPSAGSYRPNAGDWMKFNCGDVVREKGGRHTGRVEQIKWGNTIVVRWHCTGWLSDFNLHDKELELVSKAG
jgi:hypothetical protein